MNQGEGVYEPGEGEATHWGEIINEKDHDTFFQSSRSDVLNDGGTQLHGTDPMPKNHLYFVYGYTVCCGDQKKLVAWLSDKELKVDAECHVFKKIIPTDETWVVANIVNRYDDW